MACWVPGWASGVPACRLLFLHPSAIIISRTRLARPLSQDENERCVDPNHCGQAQSGSSSPQATPRSVSINNCRFKPLSFGAVLSRSSFASIANDALPSQDLLSLPNPGVWACWHVP